MPRRRRGSEIAIRNPPERVIPIKLTALQRNKCAAHNFHLTPPPKRRDFHTIDIFDPGNVDAPTSGYARLEFALLDDALPDLRRADGLSRPTYRLRRNGRHGLCVPPLRRRAGPHFDARQNQSRRGSGLKQNAIGPVPSLRAERSNPVLKVWIASSAYWPPRNDCKAHALSSICASTARPSRPYGLPSVSSISKWL